MEPIKFRQAALEHVSSLNRLDHMIRITSPHLWIIMVAIYSLLIALVVWGFIGSVPTTIEGQGILVAKSGSVYKAMSLQNEGRVQRFAVSPGDQVKKGQIIAYLAAPNLTEQVNVSRNYLNQLINQYNRQLALARQEIAAHQKNIDTQNQVLRNIIVTESKNLANLQDFLKTQRSSFQRGLDTKERLVGTLQQYYNSQQAIGNSQQRITQNQIDNATYIDQWRQRLDDLEQRIRDQQYKLEDLKGQLRLSNTIVSPVDGVITDLEATIGATLHSGDAVATITSVSQGQDAIIYVPAREGKRIRAGMKALVSPGTVKREEYGSIHGTVVSVSRFPVSRQAMLSVLQNDNLVEMFTRISAPLSVRITLQTDKETYSGFAWTSSTGPRQTITPGTLASVEITLRRQRPVSLIIPIFRKWLGIEQ